MIKGDVELDRPATCRHRCGAITPGDCVKHFPIANLNQQILLFFSALDGFGATEVGAVWQSTKARAKNAKPRKVARLVLENGMRDPVLNIEIVHIGNFKFRFG